MSNLDYPISVLTAEAKKISNSQLLSGDNQMQRANHLISLDAAIHILRVEKHKDEKKKDKRIGKENFYDL